MSKNIGIFIHPESGNVGIGTSQPRAQLEVFGSIVPSSNLEYDLGSSSLRWRELYLSGNSINLGGTTISRDATTGGIKFLDPNTNQPLDSTVRNLTASNLTVLGDYVTLNTITSNTEQMVITNTGTGPALKVTQTGANSIAEFYDDANVLALKIADGGNVGIGTANPSEKLHVAGNVNIGGSITENYIAFHGTTGDQPGTFSHTYIGERIYGGTEISELVLFKGNDLEGPSGPDRIRLIGNNITFDTYSTAVSGSFASVSTSANVTTKVTIRQDGNVGIGTTQPQANLHIQGSVFGSGLAIQCITIQYTAHTTYSSPTGLTPTEVSVLNLTITPKRATSKIVLQWMVNAEFHQDNVFLIYRGTTLIGYNTDRGNVQNSGVASAAYDQNEDSTPSNFCINWIDSPATTSAITYSLRVRSSTGASYTLYLNRTVNAAIYEAMCSNGIAWEISA